MAGVFRPTLLPCRCEAGYGLLQLGEAHFPHHLNVVRCLQSSRCRTRSYHVPILTRRPPPSAGSRAQAQTQDADEETFLVPEPLRKHWRFELKSIPVACECVL